MVTRQRLRGGAERLAYASLVNTVGLRSHLPGRRPVTPSFLLVGAQRSGTTSLFKYLTKHPNFAPPLRKEVHYFDRYYGRGPSWYEAHFPNFRQGLFTGDATPYYLFHPHAARRASQELPGARIVVLLRDPVSRARSHHQHETAKGIETLSFNDAISAEPGRLAGELERLQANEKYLSFAHQHFSYTTRGRYIDQIMAWEKYYSRERIHVIISEDMFADPQSELDRLCRFLEVPTFLLDGERVYNAYRKSPVSKGILGQLARDFRSDNERLARYLGRELPWQGLD